jgi:CDP-glucose 4,6-dehydratase
MKKIESFFKNKKIIITGHTGFKGSWLTLWLNILGAKIIGISNNIPSNPSHFEKLKLKKKIIDLNLDIRNMVNLKKAFKKYQPDFVFHLAAQSLVKKSYEEPVNTFSTNTIGTMQILEALRVIKKKCSAVIITSDKSYKNLEIKRGYHENDLLGGKDPYSASKAAAELIIQSYVNSYFKDNKINIAVARAGNVIGGGDWSRDRLIPDCVKAWSQNKKVIIRNPRSTRPWQHVLEAIRGYLVLAINLDNNNKLNGEVFNFGPTFSQDKNVISLVSEMKKHWNKVLWKVKIRKFDLYESKLLRLSSKKAKKVLHWEPALKFNETIKMTTNWYKNYYDNKSNIFKFSKEQIEKYSLKMKLLKIKKNK